MMQDPIPDAIPRIALSELSEPRPTEAKGKGGAAELSEPQGSGRVAAA